MRNCHNTPLISRNQLPVRLNSGSHWAGIHSEWDPGIVTISDFMHRQVLRDRGSECVLPSPRVTPVIPKGGLSPRLPAAFSVLMALALHNTKLIPQGLNQVLSSWAP